VVLTITHHSLLLLKEAYSDKAADSLSTAIANAIDENYPKTNVFNPNFNCDKIEDKYITFTGALLATDTQPVFQLLNAVEKWVGDGPKIAVQESVVVVVDSQCSVRISSLNSTCQTGQVGAVSPETGASSTGPVVSGLAAALVIVLVIAIGLSVIVIVLIMVLKSKGNRNCPPNDTTNKVM
jgi:hypothetical protein